MKALDFGVAGLFGDADRTDPLRRRTSLTGTLPYLSPEQVRGDAIIDTRSDIYSLGVVLYEMLSGKQPFTGQTVMDVLTAIVETEPAPLPPIVLQSLRTIVDRSPLKNLYERQQTAAEIQSLLAEVRLDPDAARARRARRRLNGIPIYFRHKKETLASSPAGPVASRRRTAKTLKFR